MANLETQCIASIPLQKAIGQNKRRNVLRLFLFKRRKTNTKTQCIASVP
jgi:hypothetical protein